MSINKTTFWSVAEGETLNRWSYSDAENCYYPGESRPMPDAVDYRFVNGWVATGDLPCREALRKELQTRSVELPTELNCPEIYLGGEDPRVDFSTFCFRPTLVTRWLRCKLTSAVAQHIKVSIETCGGVHVWQNHHKVIQLDHYQRNESTVAEYQLDLDQGETELVVFLEDLHERDTSCYFVMTLLEGKGIQSGIVLDLDEEYAKEIERTLNGLRTDKVFYCDEWVKIAADYLPSQAVKILLDTDSHPSETVTMNVLLDGMKMDREISFVVDQDFKSADLFDSTGLRAGCVSLRFVVQVDKTHFSRTLGTTLLPPPKSMNMPTLVERKKRALAYMLEQGKQEPARALAALAQNTSLDVAEDILRTALLPISERHDCADFWMLPVLWAYQGFSDIRLTDEFWQQVKHQVLNFRYWLDEPGDDVMWFWSENHVLCFHVSQYLAGCLFPNDVFPNSGKTGEQHKAQAFARLQLWFDAIDQHGLAEWNSAAYYPIDLLGLFTLMVNAEDTSLAERSKNLIDQIFVMTALHKIGSVSAGSQGRVYEKELLAGPATELASIAAVAFGGDWYPGYDRVSALLALSDYETPKICQQLMQVPDGESIYAKYTQGLDHNARVTLWKTPSLQLSTVSDYKTGIKGHQQHFVDIQTNAHPMARFWINHPGDLRVWGGSRPSYWAGNAVHPKVAHYKNFAMMIYDHRAYNDVIDFVHTFVPVSICDEFEASDNWLFARTGKALIGVYSSGLLTAHQQGLYAGMEWRVAGSQSAWLTIVDEVSQTLDFKAFKAACQARQVVFDAQQNQLSVHHDDGVLRLDYDKGISIDDQAITFAPLNVVPHIAINNSKSQPWQDYQ
ncbi:hypothetical protein [Marinomonas sp. THO17]|uniref:hypothetical protein n=1 Tax=Marinomonas sp. THO17 TaxID=3149048 RepID=UPI00336BEDCC